MATFAPTADIVPTVRHHVDAFLDSHIPVDEREVAALLVSELATNAVRHAASPFTVSAALRSELLRVEVQDCSSHLPQVQHPGPSALGGRGMLTVQRLATRWGTERMGKGKKVWFELRVP